jgi:uncharacterized protein (DUF1697 family)
MPRYIALLRGVNVGGNKMVAMADLRALLSKMGFEDVQTLLQSGNVVFSGPKKSPTALERELEAALEKALKMNVDFHVRTSDEWRKVIDANPFTAEARKDPARLLVSCYKAPLDPAKVKAAQAVITGRERLRADGRHLYMTFPDGQGNSKAAIVVGKMLGAGTARNWNTVLKLAALCETRPTDR